MAIIKCIITGVKTRPVGLYADLADRRMTLLPLATLRQTGAPTSAPRLELNARLAARLCAGWLQVSFGFCSENSSIVSSVRLILVSGLLWKIRGRLQNKTTLPIQQSLYDI